MSASIGSYFRATSFEATDGEGRLSPAAVLMLLAVGVTVVVLDRTFHTPLHMPGHHGLEAMGLLVFARLACGHRWAATIAGSGAAATASALGMDHAALASVVFLLPALTLDLGLRLAGKGRTAVWLVAVIASLAYATRALAHWVAALALGFHFGSLAHGVLYPLATHLAFGFTGGLIAALMWRRTSRSR